MTKLEEITKLEKEISDRELWLKCNKASHIMYRDKKLATSIAAGYSRVAMIFKEEIFQINKRLDELRSQ